MGPRNYALWSRTWPAPTISGKSASVRRERRLSLTCLVIRRNGREYALRNSIDRDNSDPILKNRQTREPGRDTGYTYPLETWSPVSLFPAGGWYAVSRIIGGCGEPRDFRSRPERRGRTD